MRRVVGLLLLALALVALWMRSRPARHDVATSPAASAAEHSVPGAGSAANATRAARPELPSPAAAPDAAAPSSQRAPLEAEPAGPARLAGRVLDAETDEPVPWYALEISASDGVVCGVTSDSAGRFETPEALARGKVTLRLVDADGQPRASRRPVALEHDGAGARDVRIEVGPTYFVDVALPERLQRADLRVHLFQDPPEFDHDRSRAAPEAILREPHGVPALAWLRFLEPSPLEGTPVWLELSSADGLWAGGARAPGGPGVHGEPVRVELQPRCAVRGRCVVERTSGEPGVGALALLRADGSGAPRWNHTDTDGRFRFAGLEPGAYRLEVRHDALRREPVSFALHSGELDLGELDCTPIPIAGHVRLRLWSEVELPLDVELVRRFDPPRHPLWHSDDWEPLPEGGFESRFEWEEVRAGSYDIAVHSHDLGEWHLALGELEPPVEDLALRLPSPPPPLQLEVVDDENGRALDDWTVLVRGERAWEELDGAPRSLAYTLSDPDCAFAVCSPGYQAWVATRASARWPDEGEHRVTVRMERGWSQLFLARRRSRGDPVADVEIQLDGSVAGKTDARGELWASGTSRPQHLEVSHPTLIWADGDDSDLDDLVTWIVLRP